MATSTITSPTEAPFSLESTRTRIGEKVIVAWLFLASTIAVLITIGIVFSIILPTIEFFRFVPLSSFFSFEPWAPLFADPTYGVVYIVGGTAAIVIYSGIVGLPAGLGAAIYMSEYAGPRARKILQPVLEILEGDDAARPSISTTSAAGRSFSWWTTPASCLPVRPSNRVTCTTSGRGR